MAIRGVKNLFIVSDVKCSISFAEADDIYLRLLSVFVLANIRKKCYEIISCRKKLYKIYFININIFFRHEIKFAFLGGGIYIC